jgi:hypothetical protein
LLVIPLVLTAVLSQLSAATADTVAAVGNLHAIAPRRLAGTAAFVVTTGAAIVMAWTISSFAIVAVALLGVAAMGAAIALTDFAAATAAVDIDRGALGTSLFSALPGGVAASVIGFAFGLLTRSIGGGIAAAFALVFVLDGLIGAIPFLTEWTFGTLEQDFEQSLSGDGETLHSGVVSALGMLAWIVALTVPGWLSFNRGDLK